MSSSLLSKFITALQQYRKLFRLEDSNYSGQHHGRTTRVRYIVDTGSPDAVVPGTTAIFLHGNPTSSYLWRNIIPHVQNVRRCVAPDLIGMGHSAKPALAYRFVDHAQYLDTFLSQIVPSGKVVFVIQDWGSALGFHWANRNRDRVAGIAFMEFIRPFPTWEDFAQRPAQETFKAFRDPAKGRQLLIGENAFITTMMPRGMIRSLTTEELQYYAQPYQSLSSREPIFRWPNEIPTERHPADVHKIVSDYHEWLLARTSPSSFSGRSRVDWCRRRKPSGIRRT